MKVKRVLRRLFGEMVPSVGAEALAVNGGEMIGNFRSDVEGSIAAVRIAHEEDLAWIDVAEQQKLLDEFAHQRRHVHVVEAVPFVVRSAQGQVFVTGD